MQIATVLYPGLTTLDAIVPTRSCGCCPTPRCGFVGAAPGPVDADSRVLIATAAGVDNARSSAAGSRSTPLVAGGGIGGFGTPRSQP
jgi:hypothetical protein